MRLAKQRGSVYLIREIQTFFLTNAIDFWLLTVLTGINPISIISISMVARIFRVKNVKYLPEVETSRFASQTGAMSPTRARGELSATVLSCVSWWLKQHRVR